MIDDDRLLERPDSEYSDYTNAFRKVGYIDPHIIFYVLLPPLLFEDSSNSTWNVRARHRTPRNGFS